MGRDVTPETIPANVARPHRPAEWEFALPATDPRENELLLIDLWLILRSRKGLILAVFLTAVLSATAASFLTSPVYESRAVIEIGKVTGAVSSAGRVVEEPDVVLQRLKEEHGFEDRDRAKTLPYLDSVGHPRNAGQSLIVLTAHGRTPNEAQAFLAEVTGALLLRHQKLYEQTRGAKEVQLRELEREIKAIETQAERLANLAENVDPGQAAVLILERGNLLGTFTSLREQKTDLILSLAAGGAYPTRPIQEPTLAVSPIRPNPPLYLALGTAIGLVLGIAIALIVEFLSKAREMSRVRARGTAEQVSN